MLPVLAIHLKEKSIHTGSVYSIVIVIMIENNEGELAKYKKKDSNSIGSNEKNI